MSSLQSCTPKRAEAYFNGSLIGQVSTWLADAVGELSGRGNPEPKRPRRGFLARLEATLWRQEQERREAWLAQSTDVFDLERRIRLLDRGRPLV